MQSVRALIVHASERESAALAAGLQRLGLSVDRATHPSEAAALLERGYYAVVLLDDELPHGESLNLFHALENHGWTAVLMVIVARSKLAAAQRSSQADIDYVVMPRNSGEMDWLLTRIRSRLAAAGLIVPVGQDTLSGRVSGSPVRRRRARSRWWTLAGALLVLALLGTVTGLQWAGNREGGDPLSTSTPAGSVPTSPAAVAPQTATAPPTSSVTLASPTVQASATPTSEPQSTSLPTVTNVPLPVSTVTEVPPSAPVATGTPAPVPTSEPEPTPMPSPTDTYSSGGLGLSRTEWETNRKERGVLITEGLYGYAGEEYLVTFECVPGAGCAGAAWSVVYQAPGGQGYPLPRMRSVVTQLAPSDARPVRAYAPDDLKRVEVYESESLRGRFRTRDQSFLWGDAPAGTFTVTYSGDTAGRFNTVSLATGETP